MEKVPKDSPNLEELAQIAKLWDASHAGAQCQAQRAFSHWALDTYDRQRDGIAAFVKGTDEQSREQALARIRAFAAASCPPPERELFLTDLNLLVRLCTLQGAGSDRQDGRTNELDWRVAILLMEMKGASGRVDLTLKELSPALRVSEPHLGHLFQQEVRASFRQYLRIVRLTSAATLLRDTGSCVKEVSDQLGYSDVCNFSNDFHKGFGAAPAEYRRTIIALDARSQLLPMNIRNNNSFFSVSTIAGA